MFGVRLEESLQYASVAISMVAPDGKQYVYGYVPIVVAKCGMMLKETGKSSSLRRESRLHRSPFRC